MLSVERLIFAARLRDALAAAPDRASRRPLEAQDRLALRATVTALTESGPLSPDMADIQLSILTLLPGWPTGLRVVRAMAPETSGSAGSSSSSHVKQFGAQTAALAWHEPLLIARATDGSWFHARNLKPPHDWRPAADQTRPLLSVCVAALVDRFKEDGWRIVAQLAGDSRQRPGVANEPLFLAKLSVRMAEWLAQASDVDERHPLKLIASPPQECAPLPAAERPAVSPTLHWPPSTGAVSLSLAPPHADAWAELDAFLLDAASEDSPPCKRLRTEDSAPRSPASMAPASAGVVPARPALLSDSYLRGLLGTPGMPPPRVDSTTSRSDTPFIDLTGATSPDPF